MNADDLNVIYCHKKNLDVLLQSKNMAFRGNVVNKDILMTNHERFISKQKNNEIFKSRSLVVW